VQRAEGDQGNTEDTRCDHAADNKCVSRTGAHRPTTDDAPVAVDSDEEHHQRRNVHRNCEEGEQHATQGVAEYLLGDKTTSPACSGAGMNLKVGVATRNFFGRAPPLF